MLTHLVDVSIRSVLLAMPAAVALWMMRKRCTAALQHAVWAAVVCGMLILFAFGQLLPRLPLRVLDRPVISMVALSLPVTVENWLVPEETPPATAILSSPAQTSLDWREIALYVYGIGALALLARFVMGMFLAHKLCSVGVFACDLAGTNVYESALIAVPVTVGWLRPRIILPLEWRCWDRAKLNAVLAHEGAHVRRRDGLVSALAGVNRCLFWFHPLAWILEHRLALLAEHACDEASVATLGDRDRYARLLIEMAGVVDGSQGRLRYHALTMAAGSHIGRRVEALLEEGRTFSQGLSWKGWAAVAIVGIAVVTGAGAVEFDHQKPLQQTDTIRPVISLPAVSRQEPVLIAQAAAPPVAPVHAPKARFEVASIRPPNPRPAPAGGVGRSGGSGVGTGCGAQRLSMDESLLTYRCVPLQALIGFAFGIPQHNVTGPPWLIDTSPGIRFDIEAKLPDGASKDRVPEMFQSLLEDRFKLAVHGGSREQPVSALIVDKGGLKLKEASPDAPALSPDPTLPLCPPQSQSCSPHITNGSGEQVAMTPISPGVQRFSSGLIGLALVTHSGDGRMRIDAPNTTLAGLAELLQPVSFQPVVDRTGLKARYQVLIETFVDVTSRESQLRAAAEAAQAAGGPTNAAANAEFEAASQKAVSDWDAALTKALEAALEKLGLRLETQKGQVQTIVVDHMEKMPTEN